MGNLPASLLLAALSVCLVTAPSRAAAAPELPGLPAPARPAPEETKVWVLLADKGPGARALRPGTRAFEDRPLHAPYLAALAAEGFRADHGLKWQNRVSGRIDRARLDRLRALPFVAGVEGMPRRAARGRTLERAWLPAWLAKPAASTPSTPSTSALPDLGVFKDLADTLRITPVLEWMEASGKKPGQGVRLAVMDSDFMLGHDAFDSLRSQGRIKDQYDFVDKDPVAVDDSLGDSHGAQVLSLIVGELPGKIVGAAPHADVMLYRTENSDVEAYAEEDNLAAAIERAVDSGAQVISISVVYRTEFDGEPDIPLAELDGRTRPSTLAALGAARRGVIVVTAMGNLDGKQTGPTTLSVPSDADSILAVGIVNRGRALCGYSTTGPTADNRVKPELVSMGTIGSCSVPVAGTGSADGTTQFSGTSFAAPVVAGIAVLLRQALPDESAQAIRASLLKTAHNAAQPDSKVGWGLPDAYAALQQHITAVRPVVKAVRAAAPAGVVRDAAGRRLPAEARAAGIRFPGFPARPAAGR